MGQRQAPFGPEISWPGGYSGLEYQGGDYGYPAQPEMPQYPPQAPYPPQAGYPQPALPASPNYGEHPYASFGNDGGYGGPPADGYGDPGYSNPGYDGPSSEDSGVAGTRTVRGFVESGYQDPGSGYGVPELPGPTSRHALPAPTPDYGGQDYGQPADYSQPWDYSQPLRYDDDVNVAYLPASHPSGGYPVVGGGYETDAYRPDGYGSYQDSSSYDSTYGPSGFGASDNGAPGYGGQSDFGPAGYRPSGYSDAEYPAADYPGSPQGASGLPASEYNASEYNASEYTAPEYPASGYEGRGYDSGAYNGSDLSRPGIDGAGYDLSEIIGTADFPAFGYDEPSVERLSYDDPRYEDGFDGLGSRYQGARFDETRLDNFWPGNGGGQGGRDDSRGDGGGAGAGRDRSAMGSDGGNLFAGTGRRSRETRLDMGFSAFDIPNYGDETRLDNLAAPADRPALDRTAVGLLERPVTWADETSLDSFAGVDLDEMSIGYRPEQSRAVATALQESLPAPARPDTGSQRAVGRRRGRSSDRRQWIALGAVVVAASAAIAGVLTHFAFAGPSGPAHAISTPASVDGYSQSSSLGKAMNVGALRQEVVEGSSGQASAIKDAVYSKGNLTPGAGGSQQVFMFVGGHLANSDPAASVSSFEQTFKDSSTVPAGTLGGEAVCTKTSVPGESGTVAMCAWFDNDSFGTLVSPTMTTQQLASTILDVRSGFEQVTK
ncbi:MAG TPA: hypothetical protein VMG38_01660 [Trebonia sp.]|nr:hypothetical protein [Trebonia sp.]